jgi:hypothetical protein
VQTNDQVPRKSPGDISWVRALGLKMFKEDPPKLYQIECSTILVKWFFNGRLVNMVVFFPVIYIAKAQIAVQTNDQAPRKFPGDISWVRALGLKMFKEDPP